MSGGLYCCHSIPAVGFEWSKRAELDNEKLLSELGNDTYNKVIMTYNQDSASCKKHF